MRMNMSLSINEHQLIWNEGEFNYCAGCVEKRLLKAFGQKTLFYTLNNEKKYKTLKFNFPNMRLVPYNGADKLEPLNALGYCPTYHNPKFCALHNCIKMSNHYLNNFTWAGINN